MGSGCRANTDLDVLIRQAAPGLRAAHGVGTVTAAQLLVTAGDNPDRLRNEASFAALTGTAPIPASSGKTSRHRLSRGGDRQANSALHRIALVRLSSEPRTKAYVDRLHESGKTTKEALRCLKRAIAREVFGLLTRPVEVPDTSDLRPLREEREISLTAAAIQIDAHLSRLSGLERGKIRDDALAERYREWLLTT